MMNKAFYLFLVFSFIVKTVEAQRSVQTEALKKEERKTDKKSPSRILENDKQTVTKSEVVIKGKKVPYQVTVGSLPVWDEEGNTIAGVFFNYFERTDVSNQTNRPIAFSFNGGPGTPSVWMMIGYTGPRVLNVDDEGYPLQPYGLKDNAHSILDIADIVYIDPVNTGFSRMAHKDVSGKTFFGVQADIKYLAEWINTFLSRYNRWSSPKYLIGESYGTDRVSGLALELQNNHWIYLNGVVLVSPTELGIDRKGAANAALKLPYFAATAWYHQALDSDLQKKDLTEILPEIEKFTVEEYLPAVAMGGALDAEKRKDIIKKVARYSGLKEVVVAQHNLDISASYFWKELLRDKGFTVGRLDSRYKGIDNKDAGSGPEYNAELTSWLHSFTPAINMYLREELNYKTDLKYNMFGPVHPWDRSGNKTGENLRDAMLINPNLHLLVQSGYYDGACDYFNAKYNLWQMNAGGKLQDRMDWIGYRSGHMMYLRKQDIESSNNDLRKFIQKTIPKEGQPAKF
jgi:carboxypeptidase C (cathepsin A)